MKVCLANIFLLNKLHNATKINQRRRCEVKKREQTTIRLPIELKEQLQQEADKRGFSFNALVLDILSNWVNRQR